MKKLLIFISFIPIALAPNGVQAELKLVRYEPFADLFGRGFAKPYTFRISAEVPAVCNASHIARSANDTFPGDYFWPPFAGLRQNSIENPSVKDKRSILSFLQAYFPGKFQNPVLYDSARAYSYQCYNDFRHEFYVMFSEGDTVYVISGWQGKFTSFFQAAPYDKKMSPADFIAQAVKLAPSLEKMGLSDSLVLVDSGLVWGQSTYFLQAYDKVNCLWLRHYPINVVLPPDDPAKGIEKAYNLIEISNLYDRAYFDGRLWSVLYGGARH